MEIITIDNIEYYKYGDVKIQCPIYNKNCRTGTEFIKKYKINDHIYARKIDDVWKKSIVISYKYDKVLLKKSYVDELPEIKKNTIIKDEKDIEVAPCIITLNDEQKFKDDKNNIIEIETRGQLYLDKIYFKVKDVAKAFDMERLDNIITNKINDSYVENEHYKYFNTVKNILNVNNTIKKELFLTYKGILRCLFASKSHKTDKFIDWATNTLFTFQLDSFENKKKYLDKNLGMDINIFRDISSINAVDISCIYLITLNNVDKLRRSMNISDKYNDKSIVCKFGYSKDINRRCCEHEAKYSKIKGCELKIKYYSYIDKNFLSNAEKDLNKIFENINAKFTYEDEKELVILDNKQMEFIKTEFDRITKFYSNNLNDLNDRIKYYENEIDKLNMINENKYIKEKNIYDNELLKFKIEFDMKILNFKNEYEINILEKNNLIKNIQNELETIIKLKDKDLDIERIKNLSKDKEIEALNYKIEILEKKLKKYKKT